MVITHNYLVPPNVVVGGGGGGGRGGGGSVVNKLKAPYPISCEPTGGKIVIFRQNLFKNYFTLKGPTFLRKA